MLILPFNLFDSQLCVPLAVFVREHRRKRRRGILLRSVGQLINNNITVGRENASLFEASYDIFPLEASLPDLIKTLDKVSPREGKSTRPYSVPEPPLISILQMAKNAHIHRLYFVGGMGGKEHNHNVELYAIFVQFQVVMPHKAVQN